MPFATPCSLAALLRVVLHAYWKSAQLSDPCYERHVQAESAWTEPSDHAFRCRPQLLPIRMVPSLCHKQLQCSCKSDRPLTCDRHLVSQCGAILYSVPGMQSVAATPYLAASSAPRSGCCTLGTAGAFPFPRAAAAVAAAAAALCCSRPKCSSTAAPSCSMQLKDRRICHAQPPCHSPNQQLSPHAQQDHNHQHFQEVCLILQDQACASSTSR